jgi:acyl-CoA thioesterase
MLSPKEIVSKMLEEDQFSQWLGVELISIEKGACILSAQLREEMVNGFHIAHGGITYSLSDSALAFAANSYGNQCVSVETSISHTRPVQIGDELTAQCKEIHRGKKIGIYQVEIFNQERKKVSFFKGTVHISDHIWEKG